MYILRSPTYRIEVHPLRDRRQRIGVPAKARIAIGVHASGASIQVRVVPRQAGLRVDKAAWTIGRLALEEWRSCQTLSDIMDEVVVLSLVFDTVWRVVRGRRGNDGWVKARGGAWEGSIRRCKSDERGGNELCRREVSVRSVLYGCAENNARPRKAS